MSTVRAFCAFRYDDSRVDLARVLVSELVSENSFGDDEKRDFYYALEPRNIIRVLSNKSEEADDDRSTHDRANAFFGQWRRARVVTQDEDPALYVLRATSRDGDSPRQHIGVFAALHLDNNAEQQVESAPVDADAAFAGLDAVQLDPVCMGVDDDKGRLLRALSGELEEEPDLKFDVGNIEYELWIVDDETTCARVEQHLAQTRLVVEDGHQRFHNAVAQVKEGEELRQLAVFLSPISDDNAWRPPLIRGLAMLSTIPNSEGAD